MDKNKLFIYALKTFRLSLGMTQTQFAEKALVNEKYYGRIERGESSPTLKIIIKIFDGLNIKTSDFLLLMYEHKD